MSIGAANLFTRNFWKAYVDPHVTDAGETRVAKITSLVVKVGALLVILYLPTQFALDLQLLGGLWILQTLPALIFGLFTRWFTAPSLLAGWAVGLVGGTYLAWIDGLKPLHPVTFGDTTVTVYVGIIAFAANVIAAVLVNLAVKQNSRERTRAGF
jgi:SSS family solute:Na+ symporter